MAIDPSIPLSVKTPTFVNPLEQYSQALGVKNQIQQGQIGAQQLQSGNIALQQQQMDLQDQQNMRQQLPALVAQNGGDFGKAVDALAATGSVSPKTLFTLKGMALTNAKTKADTDEAAARAKEATAAAQEKETDALGQVALHVKAAGYSPAAFEGALQLAGATNPAYAQHVQMIQQAVQQDPTKIQAITDELIGASKTAKETVLKQQESARQADADARATAAQPDILAKNRSEADIAAADAKIKQTQADAVKNLNPQTIGAQVDAEMDALKNGTKDPALLSEIEKQRGVAKTAALGALSSVGTAAAVQAAIKDSVDQIGRTSSSVAAAHATEGSKVYVGSQIAQAGANVKEQEAAKSDYVTSLDAVHKTQAVAQTIKELVAKVKAGDAEAAKLIGPQLAALSNAQFQIKRVQGSQSDLALGSAEDRVKGFVNSLASGVPASGRILDEIPGVVDTITQTGVRAHNMHVTTSNGIHNTSFQQEPEAGASVPQAVQDVLKSAGPGVHKLSDGTSWLKDANGTITKQ
jgi:hypothetical protein